LHGAHAGMLTSCWVLGLFLPCGQVTMAASCGLMAHLLQGLDLEHLPCTFRIVELKTVSVAIEIAFPFKFWDDFLGREITYFTRLCAYLETDSMGKVSITRAFAQSSFHAALTGAYPDRP
jgi:hypothetical protein